jgi:hypothetical protein
MSPGKARVKKFRDHQQLKFDDFLVDQYMEARESADEDEVSRRRPARFNVAMEKLSDDWTDRVVAETRFDDPSEPPDVESEPTPHRTDAKVVAPEMEFEADPFVPRPDTSHIADTSHVEDCVDSEFDADFDFDCDDADEDFPETLRLRAFAAAIGTGVAAAAVALIVMASL